MAYYDCTGCCLEDVSSYNHQIGGLYHVYLPEEIRELVLTLTTSFRKENYGCVEGNIAEEFFKKALTSLGPITYPRVA